MPVVTRQAESSEIRAEMQSFDCDWVRKLGSFGKFGDQLSRGSQADELNRHLHKMAPAPLQRPPPDETAHNQNTPSTDKCGVGSTDVYELSWYVVGKSPFDG
jgi:hypothetical protein